MTTRREGCPYAHTNWTCAECGAGPGEPCRPSPQPTRETCEHSTNDLGQCVYCGEWYPSSPAPSSPSGADDPMDRGCEYVACAWACPKRKITGTCDGCSARPVFASGADDVEALVDDLILQARDWDEIVDGDPLRPSVEVARAALLAAIRDREERARREVAEGAVQEVSRWHGDLLITERAALLDSIKGLIRRIRALSEREEG